MVHSLTLNYMDKVSQLIFFCQGGGKGGGGVRLVRSCSLRVAVPSPPPDKGKTVRGSSFSLFFFLCWGEGAATRRLSQLPLFESAL